MDLFDKIMISKDEKTQRIRLSRALLGFDAIHLTMYTIFLYMVPTAISKYVVDIMNLYVFGILAGLSGAVWGCVITRNMNKKEEIMKKQPWYSYDKYHSLMFTISNKGFYRIIGIFIELVVIYILKIY